MKNAESYRQRHTSGDTDSERNEVSNDLATSTSEGTSYDSHGNDTGVAVVRDVNTVGNKSGTEDLDTGLQNTRRESSDNFHIYFLTL